MEDYRDQLKNLSEIRSLMEQSAKFISLSGLSGVSAGIIALIGAYGASNYLMGEGLLARLSSGSYIIPTSQQLLEVVGIGVIILVSALAASSFFSIRLARKKQIPIWNKAAGRTLFNLLIPLIAGALFCIQMMYYGFVGLVAPATLIFYGLALLNASKYTLIEVRYLGISEIILGLLAGVFTGYGIIFWAIGFGIFHIVYGIMMYLKYER